MDTNIKNLQKINKIDNIKNVIKTYEAQTVLSHSKINEEIGILNIKVDKYNEKIKELNAKKERCTKYYADMIQLQKTKLED